MPKFRRMAALGVAVAIALAGCASGPDGDAADDRPTLIASFSVIADMAAAVAGDHVRVESLTRLGVQLHGYEPTPGDLMRAADADLVLVNGLGIDEWLEQFLDQEGAPIVVLTEGIEPIPITTGHSSGHPNPHAWMSPVAARIYLAHIVDAVTTLAPEHAVEFAANAAALQSDLDDALTTLSEAVATMPVEHQILVTCEAAFSYLARDAGLDEASLWPVNSAGQGTPQSIAAVQDVVEERQVPTIFCESTTNPATQQQIAAATGARFEGGLFVDSLSEPGGLAPSYLALVQHDVELIIEGLSA